EARLSFKQALNRDPIEFVPGESDSQVLGCSTRRLPSLIGGPELRHWSTHADGAPQKRVCSRHGEQNCGGHSPGGLSGHRHLGRVTPKRLNVLLHPLQCSQPVEDAAVDSSVLNSKEALDTQAV